MLNLMDLIDRPRHGTVEIGVDIVEIFNEANLVSIPGKESEKLLFVHASKDSPCTDLETIQMQDWQYRPRFCWIDVLDPMPGSTCSQRKV